VVADDHSIVRQGLRVLLDAEPDFEVVGDVGDGLAAVQMVEQLKPDVLVLDLMLPGLHGLEVASQVSRHVPQTRVVVLSMHRAESYVLQALRNGASGYVLKEADASEVVHAVREVIAGRRYLSPPLSQRAIESYLSKTDESLDLYDTLTDREREVLQLVAEGCSTSHIAERLFISPRTVEGHRSRLMRKLGLHTYFDVIRLALRRGIISMEGELPGESPGEPPADQ
jgi:DNA-binding NarL/FixJ family response regulator